MLRLGAAPGAIVVLLGVLLFAGCDEGEAPLSLAESAGDSTPSASQTIVSSSTSTRPSRTPTPVERLCGRRDLSARYTQDGRLRSPAIPTPPIGFGRAPIIQDQKLRDTIERSLGSGADDFGVAVVNVRDGRAAFWNDERPFYAASLFKLTVLYEVYRQRELRSLAFDERLLYTPYYQDFDLVGAPVCELLRGGGGDTGDEDDHDQR